MTLTSPPVQAAEADGQIERFAEWAEEHAVEGATELAKELQPVPPRARPLSELVRFNENDPDELLRFRYLCRSAPPASSCQVGRDKAGQRCRMPCRTVRPWR